MRARLNISRSAVDLIKAFEGFRAKAARLDDGRWTIGYGHTQTAREGAEISESDAEALLLYDLIPVAHAVNELIFAPLNQNQFDALASFVFNIGVRGFRGSLTYRRLNEGRFIEAALGMEMWRKADLEGERIVVDALVRRRAAEKALFLRPIEGWTPAPTPVVPPKFDYDAVGVMPLQTPIVTRSPMAGDRAFVERAPERPFDAPEEPSASQAAADAVIERLQSLMPDAEGALTTATLDPAEAEAAPAPAAEPTDALAFDTGEIQRRAGPRTFILFGLAIVGIGLLGVAFFWLTHHEIIAIAGLPTIVAALASGGLGVITFALAAYLALERLGLPQDSPRR